MNRTLWFVAGATTGVYALTKARRAAEAFTPEGMRDRMAGLAVGAHLFKEEVETDMAIKENDLRRRLRLELSGPASPVAALHPRSNN